MSKSHAPMSTTAKLEARMFPSMIAKKPIRLNTVETLKNRVKSLESTIDDLYAAINAKDQEIKRYESKITSQKAKIKFKLSQECIGDGNDDEMLRQNQDLNETLRKQQNLLDVRSIFIDRMQHYADTVRALIQEKEMADKLSFELECELLEKNEMIDVLRSLIGEKVAKLEILTANESRD